MISLCFIADTEIASGFLYIIQLVTMANALTEVYHDSSQSQEANAGISEIKF
jgi:hypothetical protein